jgi:hypothetical protein
MQISIDENEIRDFEVPEEFLDEVTNQERFAKIEERLNGLETALPVQPPKPSERWIRRAWTWIINHKGTSVFLALFSIFGGGYFKYYLDHKNDDFNRNVNDLIDKKLTAVSRQMEQMSRDLTKVETTLDTLRPFIEDLVRKEMGRIPYSINTTIGALSSAKTESPKQLAYRFKEAKFIVTTALEKKDIATNPHALEIRKRNLQDILHTVFLPESVKEDGTSLLIRLDAYQTFSENILSGHSKNGMSNTTLNGRGVAISAIGGDPEGLSRFVAFRLKLTGFKGQDIAYVKWVEPEFENDQITYNGGPLYLDRARFINCLFVPWARDPESMKFLHTIEVSNGNPVTIMFPGQ